MKPAATTVPAGGTMAETAPESIGLVDSAAPDRATDLATAYRDFLGQMPRPSP